MEDMAQPRTGTVLIVDDEAIIRDSLQQWLEMEGYRVFAAENGEKALQLCKFESFDVGVFDIRMPGMDGISLLKQTRRDYPEMAVIMMTAFASIEDAVLCISSGAHDYVIKPFPPEKLSQAIRNLMESRHLHARQQGLIARQDLLQQFARETTPFLTLGAVTAVLAGAAWVPGARPELEGGHAGEALQHPLIDHALEIARPALAVVNSDLNRIADTTLALAERERGTAQSRTTGSGALALQTAAPFVPCVLALHLLISALTTDDRPTPEIRALRAVAGSRRPRLQLLAAGGWSAADRARITGEVRATDNAGRAAEMARLLLQQMGAGLQFAENQIVIDLPPAMEPK